MPSTTKKNQPLVFTVVAKPSGVPKGAKRAAFLIKDNWDDWGKYQTQFHLVVFDGSGIRHEPGDVKIASVNPKSSKQSDKSWKTVLPFEFTQLDDSFFSLGQDESYYVKLMNLKEDLRNQLLKGLRDLVQDQDSWQHVRNELVTQESLLRFVKPRTVESQFLRILSGGVRLTPYNLTYTSAKRAEQTPLTLSFEVEPERDPPTNIHVLIGPNGVGKTFLLQQMTKALVGGDHPLSPRERAARIRWAGKFTTDNQDHESPPITNLVSVSFSAFDHFDLVAERKPSSDAGMSDYILYSYIGLRRANNTKTTRGRPKTGPMLAREFVASLKACVDGPRLTRWRRALKTLEADPIFKAADISSLTQRSANDSAFSEHAADLFSQLSSGHKLVLLTITRLVETVDEQTLILFDEPEAHLHPPLLSAFIRALSDLLINRNGLAIVATHSPVVLQEVPKSCVWKLRRPGQTTIAERPEMETFGENVGVLTNEVFGLDVTQSGFHTLISQVVEQEREFERVLNYFGKQLGAEAEAIVLGLSSVEGEEGVI